MSGVNAPRCVVLIPALNEALAIRAVVEDALAHCPDVIVIDDGSTDGTADAIADLGVTVVTHPQRRGKGESLRTGFREAMARGYDAVLTMDGDGQHAGEDLPRLMAAATRDPRALILCSRSIGRGEQPWLRRFANRLGDFWISWACGQRVRDSQCGQRLYPRVVLETVPLPASDNFAFESEILIDAARRGFAIASVEIRARYHQGRRASHFRPLVDFARIARVLARKIVGHGMYLPGLVRALRRPALRLDP